MAKLRIKNYYTFNDFILAYYCCLKHKRNSKQATSFRTNLIENLSQLRDEVNSETYKPGTINCFAVLDPKPREIWASQFRDRIIHHLIINDIFEYFYGRIIGYNCSCVPGRGNLFAIDKAIANIRSVSQNYQKQTYVLKCDLKNFFVSINRQILWDLITPHFDDSCLTGRLLKSIIFRNLSENAHFCWKNLRKVPKHKSLINSDNTHGLPVGDLTSQILSGYIYLNELDQFIKRQLKIKHYVRYVDDFVITSNDKDYLKSIIPIINSFLQEHLKIELNLDKTKIIDISKGFLFLGRFIKNFRTYTNNRTIGNFKNSNDYFGLNSYLGLLRHSKSYNIRKLIMDSKEFKTDNNYLKLI